MAQTKGLTLASHAADDIGWHGLGNAWSRPPAARPWLSSTQRPTPSSD